jgi:hypothetical protein
MHYLGSVCLIASNGRTAMRLAAPAIRVLWSIKACMLLLHSGRVIQWLFIGSSRLRRKALLPQARR